MPQDLKIFQKPSFGIVVGHHRACEIKWNFGELEKESRARGVTLSLLDQHCALTRSAEQGSSPPDLRTEGLNPCAHSSSPFDI